MRIDELIEALKAYPPHTDVAISVLISDGELSYAEREIRVEPWNENGFCVLLRPE